MNNEKNTQTIKENKFYNLCDVIDALDAPEVDYLPSEEELKMHDVENHLKKYMPFLMWLAEKYYDKNYIKYKAFAKYVNNLTTKYVV